MAISQLYPNTRPTLNLNFARSKTLDPRITFTRNSTATYVGSDGLIKTAAAGEARFDHNSNGDSLGLLIEESKTNLIGDSKCTDTSYWSLTTGNPQIATVGSATELAPNGQNEALLMNDNSSGAGTAFCYFNKNLTLAAAGDYIWSCYVKRDTTANNDADLIYCSVAGFTGSTPAGAVRFDWSTTDWLGGDKTAFGDRLFPPVDVGNGWYRIAFRCTVDSGDLIGAFRFGLANSDNGNSNKVIKLGYNGGLFWGAQLEAGSFPTSHIPTSGSTVQRLRDQCDVGIDDWWDDTQGTIVLDADYSQTSDTMTLYSADLGGGIKHRLRQEGASIRYTMRNTGGGTVFNFQQTATPKKTVFGYATDNLRFAYDNSLSSLDTSGTPPTGILYFRIGRDNNNSNPLLAGHIKRLTYYNTRLSDTTLEALTL